MYTYFYGKLLSKLLSSGQMPGRAVKFPPIRGNVKSNALGLPGGGLIAVGFDSYIIVECRTFQTVFNEAIQVKFYIKSKAEY
jgi:hypothetical protein